jgi:integrase/recombinase XerD
MGDPDGSATIDAYSRIARRISELFDRYPNRISTADLKQYFAKLIRTHSWSTVKLGCNGLQFIYRYTLDKQWEWFSIVKPPQMKRLPDILTPAQVSQVTNGTKKLRYQVFFLTLYNMKL